MTQLGGWWRLWIAFTALVSAGVCLLAFNLQDKRVDVDRKAARAGHFTPASCVPGTVSFQETDAFENVGTPVEGPWNDYKTPLPPPGMILDKDDPSFQLVANCTGYVGVARRLATAVLASAIVLLSALTLRWIGLGFRSRSQ